jgi:hypothetical protein
MHKRQKEDTERESWIRDHGPPMLPSSPPMHARVEEVSKTRFREIVSSNTVFHVGLSATI